MRMPRTFKFFSALALVFSSAGFPLIAAEEYAPPSSPELYEKADPYVPPKHLKGHGYLGGGLGFGQSRSTGSGDAVTSYDLSLGLGYVKPLGTWSLAQAGVDIFTGSIGHGSADMNISLGALAKIGYGYSLGTEMFGSFLFGAGVAQASYLEEDTNGQVFKGPSNNMGSVVMGAYELLMQAGDSMFITGGFYMTQYTFSVSDLTLDTGGPTNRVNKTVQLNSPEVKIGFRVKLGG